jgi:phosphoribosylformylglycinamidine (FGAM) synthase-like enzyme
MIAGEDAVAPLGLEVDLDAAGALAVEAMPPHEILLSESPCFLLEVSESEIQGTLDALRAAGSPVVGIGRVIEGPALRLRAGGEVWCDPDVAALHCAWSGRMRGITHAAAPDEGGD